MGEGVEGGGWRACAPGCLSWMQVVWLLLWLLLLLLHLVLMSGVQSV